MGAYMRVSKATGGVEGQLKYMAAKVKHPEGVWPTVGSYIAAANKRQWATQGAYYGTPWKPLKPDYLTWKVSRGYSPQMLVQTGSMRRSFTSRPMSVEVYSGDSARFGSDHPLAKYHQFGTHRNGKRVNPSRQMMHITPKVRQDIKEILADYIRGRRSPVLRLI